MKLTKQGGEGMADIGYYGCDLSDFRGVDSLVGDDLKPCRNRLPIAGAPLDAVPHLSFCAL